MKGGKINIGKFTIEDTIKANRKASREVSLENSTGWISLHKVHKSAKNYTRNSKHKKDYSFE
jgi:hypothetical protein